MRRDGLARRIALRNVAAWVLGLVVLGFAYGMVDGGAPGVAVVLPIAVGVLVSTALVYLVARVYEEHAE